MQHKVLYFLKLILIILIFNYMKLYLILKK